MPRGAYGSLDNGKCPPETVRQQLPGGPLHRDILRDTARSSSVLHRALPSNILSATDLDESQSSVPNNLELSTSDFQPSTAVKC
ncbi:hypothetical protein [Leptolyngbya sp. FACHB-671]|uniref:hypothetical protein n=1 Tax=Leptolyngbya sp. FACHB-671 TaxID=2692812 RepID=UPI001F548CA7|nr:hypothetical protein [Leptolyngbya sp. FACHB-671]